MRRLQFFLFLFISFSVFFYDSLSAEESMLARYDLDNPESHVKLAPVLKEISGIAVTDDNRLFAHDDEKGTVFQLDMKSGKIIKHFSLFEERWFGQDPVMEDFEDIAVSGKQFYMVSSAGVIYGFREGNDGEKVDAVRHETFLNDLYDVEGLCYDPESDALLLACKEYPKEFSLQRLVFDKENSKRKEKPVYSFSLKSMSLDKTPRFLIDSKFLKKKSAKKKFKPSAIERHPQSKTYFVLAARGKLLVEIDPQGKIIDVARLPSKDHAQPEGLAFTADNEMLISNEGVGGNATLLRYSMRKQRPAIQ